MRAATFRSTSNGTGHYAYEQTVTVSAQHQGLEHPVQVFSQLLRHVGGLQMLLVHLIGDQGIGDSGGVQQPGGICFLNLHAQIYEKIRNLANYDAHWRY